MIFSSSNMFSIVSLLVFLFSFGFNICTFALYVHKMITISVFFTLSISTGTYFWLFHHYYSHSIKITKNVWLVCVFYYYLPFFLCFLSIFWTKKNYFHIKLKLVSELELFFHWFYFSQSKRHEASIIVESISPLATDKLPILNALCCSDDRINGSYGTVCNNMQASCVQSCSLTFRTSILYQCGILAYKIDALVIILSRNQKLDQNIGEKAPLRRNIMK